VTDGFTGNVILKTLEGGLRVMVGAMLAVLTGTDEIEAAARIVLPALAPLAEELEPDSYGGAMLLGVDGVCIISHGSSSARAIVNAVRVAHDAVDQDLVSQLRAVVTRVEQEGPA
ncbi:MAG TPA: phosphate acyltransferase, partial [Acidimicrobiales bacterium]|nr:phosphate acyltransferase [Acidimicrobiales bacterium]